jgi:Ulp1 family protease
VSFDLLEVMVIPINIGNGRHWCIIVIDPRKLLIFFYDPLERGVQRVTLLEIIKQYFRELYISRSCNVEINSKCLSQNLKLIGRTFPIQEDFIYCGVYILIYDTG